MFARHYLKAVRKALDITQEELGDVIGKSNGMISLYERGLIDSFELETSIKNALANAYDNVVKNNNDEYKKFLDLKIAVLMGDIEFKEHGYISNSTKSRIKNDCKTMTKRQKKEET